MPNFIQQINAEKHRLKVFFDGSCPLCSREIKLYRQLTGSVNCDWIDANTIEPEETPSKLTRADLVNRFHVEHCTEGVLSGSLAFALLWREIFGWSWIYTVMKIPIVNLVCDFIYGGFLPLRKIIKFGSGQK